MNVDLDQLKDGESMIVHLSIPSDNILLAKSEGRLVIFPIVTLKEADE